MDGLDATRRIRQLSPTKLAAGSQPRVIAMTANALREDAATCLAAGMDDYLSKPIQPEELVGALSKCQPRRPPATGQPVKGPEPTTAEPRSPKVLDTWTLERLRVGLGQDADEMLPGLIERFRQDAERLLRQARQALGQQDADELLRAAHSLKSTSATFGAQALSAVARKMEALARDGQLEAAGDQLAPAEEEFAKAKFALEAMQDDA
jgi:CheY-like chemotaxis protein